MRVFVQVIQGAVSDPEQVHAAIDRWAEELADGAPQGNRVTHLLYDVEH
jgi:hypothetical protein